MTSQVQRPPPAQEDPSLSHLMAELARIDLLVRREVRRWQLAGQDPADAFRGLHVTQEEAAGLLKRPFGAGWGHMVSLPPDEERAFARAEGLAAQRAEQIADLVRQQGDTPRLTRLAAAFGLDRFDQDALLVCLAPTMDLRYERLYAYLQDDVTRKRPSVNLVLDLLCGPGPERLAALLRFADEAPLFKYQLLERVREPGPAKPIRLSQSLGVDEAAVAWLLGGFQPHADLAPYVTLVQPEAGHADELLAAVALPHLEQALAMSRPIVVFTGPDRAGQQAAARMLAVRAGRPLLAVDLGAATAANIPALRALRLGLRDARLTDAIPCLAGWDVCLPSVDPRSGGAEGPTAAGSDAVEGSSPPPDLLAELCAFPGMVLVAGKAAWQAEGIDRDRTLLWLDFPTPGYPQRLAAWRHFLGLPGGTSGETFEVSELSEVSVALTALAGQFALTAGQIRDAVATARDRASQRGEALQARDLLAAARAHSNPRLSTLARKIAPRYTWQDIVLPDDQTTLLREIVATVRSRALVLEEWGLGRKLVSSPGVTMLFTGPPGTGKTMAAEVMANELGLDVYKIDLSSVVSKYIGETEKNLERIFGEAQTSNAILFFDEADAIFGKRSEVKDAHDRYANIEISYLLQRMEMYDGVTMLATNLRANLDEAFTRRLQFAVDFPFPDEANRLRIWQTLVPPGVPREPDLDFALLARRFKLAGGNIRNILVGATYLAAADGQRVSMRHLLHGTRRELQKMGRLVNEQDMRER